MNREVEGRSLESQWSARGKSHSVLIYKDEIGR